MIRKILLGLLFMVLASPQAFTVVRSLLGGWVASAEGLPKVGGLALHALVLVTLSTLLWRMPIEGYAHGGTLRDVVNRAERRWERRQERRARRMAEAQ